MNNFLKNIFSGFGKINSGNTDSAVGIDIGSSSIKVVEIRRKEGRAVLETYGAIALGPYGDQDAGSVTNLPIDKVLLALKEVIRQSGITDSSAGVAIPIQSSLIFTIDIPGQVDKSELSTVVSTEARKYIPVPISEVSIDYFIIPEKEPSYAEMNKEKTTSNEPPAKMEILVVATQNDAVSKYRSVISQCNMNASFFEIEIFSSIRANFEHELSPVLLIDFGASRTKLSVVEFGLVKYYHTIDRGGSDITNSISKSLGVPFSEAEKMKKDFGFFGNPLEKSLVDIIKVHFDYIFSEANSVILSYEKKYNRTISKIIFTGGGSLMKGLKDVAINSFQCEIEIGRPFTKVEAPAFLDKVLDTMGPEFAVALGLALRKLQ